MHKLLVSVLAVLFGAGAAPAQAAVIAGSITGGSVSGLGTFVKLDTSVPFTVGQDNFNTNNLYAFDEVQDFVLTDVLIANLGLTNIAAGTRVNSHFIFFDPLPNATVKGSITFDTPVLAAITQRSTLIASNYLGAAGVTYLDPGSVGLELGIDFVTLGNPNANTLSINLLTTDSPGDHFRVITLAGPAAVPEPTTWALMLAGFGLIGGILRRRRRHAVGMIAA